MASITQLRSVRIGVALAASAALGAGATAAVRSPAPAAAAPSAVRRDAVITPAVGQVAAPAAPTSKVEATFVAATTDSVTVQGIGTVEGVPDVVTVGLQVSVTRVQAADALDAANSAVGKVIASLRHSGVAAKDIQTTGLSLQPQYDYSGTTQTLTGYEAGQSISARLRSATKRGTTISGAAGASSGDVAITGLSYDLQKDGSLLTRAQQAAFAAAQRKAVLYARLAHRSLGRVMTVTEGSTDVPTPQPFVASGGLAAGVGAPATSVPIAAGTTPVSVSVTVTWALT